MCEESKSASVNPSGVSTHAPVPDFTVAGFSGGGASTLAEAHARLPNLQALKLSACLGASYNTATNQICFTVPVYGDACVTSPVRVPVGGALKACVETCGSIIPTGVKVTIYLNNNPIFNGTIFGFC